LGKSKMLEIIEFKGIRWIARRSKASLGFKNKPTTFGNTNSPDITILIIFERFDALENTLINSFPSINQKQRTSQITPGT
jgi:hypothetical protein